MKTLRAWVVASLAALVLSPAAVADTKLPPPRLTEERAAAILLDEDGVRAWVARYPRESLVTEGEYDEKYRDWTVKAWSGDAGQIVFSAGVAGLASDDDAVSFFQKADTALYRAKENGKGRVVGVADAG